MSWLLIPSLHKRAWSEHAAFVIRLWIIWLYAWCGTTQDELLGSLDAGRENCDNYYKYISSSPRNTKWSFIIILVGSMSQKVNEILVIWIHSKDLTPHPNILFIILDVHITRIIIMLPRSISDENEWELKVKNVLITWWSDEICNDILGKLDVYCPLFKDK